MAAGDFFARVVADEEEAAWRGRSGRQTALAVYRREMYEIRSWRSIAMPGLPAALQAAAMAVSRTTGRAEDVAMVYGRFAGQGHFGYRGRDVARAAVRALSDHVYDPQLRDRLREAAVRRGDSRLLDDIERICRKDAE